MSLCKTNARLLYTLIYQKMVMFQALATQRQSFGNPNNIFDPSMDIKNIEFLSIQCNRPFHHPNGVLGAFSKWKFSIMSVLSIPKEVLDQKITQNRYIPLGRQCHSSQTWQITCQFSYPCGNRECDKGNSGPCKQWHRQRNT